MSSTLQRSTFPHDSDDEIVWSLSDDERESSPSPSLTGSSVSYVSNDFVILSYPHSPTLQTRPSTPSEDQGRRPQLPTPITSTSLEKRFSCMKIAGRPKGDIQKSGGKKAKPADSLKKQRKNSKKAKKATNKPGKTVTDSQRNSSPAPVQTSAKVTTPTPVKPNKPRRRDNTSTTEVDGSRPVGTDGSTQSNQGPTLHEEASTFISRFLSNPDAKHDSVCRLTLLQSLIIELGLATSNLPASLNSARTYLKSRAFLNIREYIAVRSQGPEAIQKVLYPSRSALIKNIKRNRKNRAPLQWVKDIGLQVLLVKSLH